MGFLARRVTPAPENKNFQGGLSLLPPTHDPTCHPLLSCILLASLSSCSGWMEGDGATGWMGAAQRMTTWDKGRRRASVPSPLACGALAGSVRCRWAALGLHSPVRASRVAELMELQEYGVRPGC